MTAAFDELMSVRGGDLPPEGEVTITGADPVFSTRFKIGETCASVLASIWVSLSDIWGLKTGRRQNVSVNTRHAAAALRSTNYMQRPDGNGGYGLVSAVTNLETRPLTQPWPTKDGRWFLPHFSLAHLAKRVRGVLGCNLTKNSVSKAVARWNALDLEAAIEDARACGAMVRSNSEWLDHPHGKNLQAKPVVKVIKIGDSGPEPFP